jgi:phosphatidate cytidylyltransferase
MTAIDTLTVRQQVALLFVIVFGLLVAVSLIAWAQVWHGRSAVGDSGRRELRFAAELRAVWGASVLFWIAWMMGPHGATLLFAVLSFLSLREFITLAPTRRGDHRSLVLAFFVVLPAQYIMVANRHFDLFTVFIPVYVFLAIPVLSALGGDPERFLERNAKIQWGITVCVYGLSHTPALLLLEFPHYQGRGEFLVVFLVVVAASGQIMQESASRWLRRRPLARMIDRSFSLRAWLIGAGAAAGVGALLYWITPFGAPQAFAIAFVTAGSGTLGEFVMRALKKDAGVRWWGNTSSLTGAVGLLDRIAPLAFAAPVFFHSVRWYFALRL